MKQMEQQNVKYDPQIRKLQKERYADQGNDIAEEQLEEESVYWSSFFVTLCSINTYL